MAGLLGYVLLSVFGPYLVLALLPPGWLVRGVIAIGLLAGFVGWQGWLGDPPEGHSFHPAQPSLVFFGLGSGLAALVRSVRLVFPTMRLAGSYGVLVLFAPFLALFAFFLRFGAHD
jgi:hypothetical protein